MRDPNVLMRGPCLACRQPMNWIVADPRCSQMCRWCLLYFSALEQTGCREYLALLVNAVMRHGHERGEPIAFITETGR